LQRRPLAFGALVVFFALYYYRPEDFIKPLSYVPMARVTGVIAFVALLSGMAGGEKTRIPTSIRILWLLLVQLLITIPFALWPGGAFHQVVDKYAKAVIVAMLISMVVVTMAQIRKLLWIQVSAIALVTFLSIATRHYWEGGRLSGIQKSILENPNDLAINIAITFPLGMAFMICSRGLKKVVWSAALAVMCVGVVLTQSRSGLLALLLTVAITVWEYGVKGKRRQLVIVSIAVAVLGMGAALSSAHYRARVESIFLGKVQGIDAGEAASLEARKELLHKSITVALQHPLLGVGPGCFPIVDNTWHAAHNAYTELAAEAGMPALLLFLTAIGAAFKNIAVVRKSQRYRDDAEFRVFTQAIWAGLIAFLAGSCAASTEYNLYPYFVIGYSCAMVRIIGAPATAEDDGSKALDFSRSRFTVAGRPQMSWNR
jgi:O-antigen ligase